MLGANRVFSLRPGALLHKDRSFSHRLIFYGSQAESFNGNAGCHTDLSLVWSAPGCGLRFCRLPACCSR
jgi:hypothetical protein